MSKEVSAANIIILAGGKGLRMGDLTQNTQKCLIPVDGKPMLGHVLDSVSQAFGSAEVTLCVSFKADDVASYIEKNTPPNIRVSYSYDEGGSRVADFFRAVEGTVPGPFLALAGDIITSPSLYTAGYERVLEEGVLASVSASPDVAMVDTHAACKIKDGRLTEILFPPPDNLDPDHLRDMTTWGWSEDFYSYARRYPYIGTSSGLIHQALIDQEYVAGNVYDEPWFHLGYSEDLKKRHR